MVDMKKHLSQLLAIVVIVSLLSPPTARLLAADWSIPVAGNAFRSAPAPGRGLQRSGSLVWGDAEGVFSVYFHVDRPAKVRLALLARVEEGRSTLETRVGEQKFETEIDGSELEKHQIGHIAVASAGYVRVDFQGTKRTGDVYAEIRDLIVSSDSDDLKLDFVKTNKGNMFYWGRRGPSVHLRYEVPRDLTLQYAYSEITVPKGQDPIGSYFMANGFGEGYFGIQVNSPKERRVLFSVWSPFKTDNPRDIPKDQRIAVLGRGPDVHVGEFGNEGSGGQSYLVYPWKAGTTYRFLTEVKPDGKGNTFYTSWFGDKSAGEWRLIASFRRPKTDTHYRGFHSFLESFSPTFGHIGRRANYGNVWVRDTSGKWHECTRARFSVDATGRGRHRLDFTGGSDGKHFTMRNCGFFNETGRPGETFTRESTSDKHPKVDLDALQRTTRPDAPETKAGDNRRLAVLKQVKNNLRPKLADAEIRWASKFKETYTSQAEGTDVAFAVQAPPKVDSMDTYPLLIALSGGFRVAPSERFPFFQANPTRTRIWGYRSISTYDAMQVVALMKSKYPIDPDRVYLMGSSAGGSGAMHLASCYPDEFAAVLPLIAAGNNYPLANFKNLPVAFHHGDKDWTSSICNARVQAQRMQAFGCPVILKEYEGAGHSVPGSHEPLMTWLFEQNRNPVPHAITHDCEAPSLGRSYWVKIREFDDPHQRAFVEATINDDTVTIRPKNIIAFSLALDGLPNITTVQIGETRLPVSANHANYEFQDGRWRNADKWSDLSIRSYESGAAANLYQGEPLIVVYGTAGGRTDQLRAAARTLAKYGGSDYTTMPGMFSVVADSDLTAEQEAKSNLILVGTPAENSISQSLLPQLPIKIQGGALEAGGRTKLPLENQVLSMLHPNPNHPKRLVYLLAPFTDKAAFARFTAAPQRFLAGSDGFDRASQADLLVQNTKHQIARQMQFGKDWSWIEFPGADKLIPARYADRAQLAIIYMKMMKAKSNADFALWWGPADKGMWGADFNDLERYNPEFYREADFRTQQRHYETTIATVSGADLKIIWNRWGTNQELQSVPEVTLDKIEDEEQYRIHIPMDLYIKLGQRKKNLVNPKEAARIPAKEVLVKIFE
jgi:hypothetical protein